MASPQFNFNFNELFAKAFGNKNLSRDARIATMRFRESIEALSDIYDRIVAIEYKILQAPLEPDNRNTVPLRDLQKDFIRETNSFHQQTYATISAFVRVLLHITPKQFSATIPRRSLKSFLEFLKNKKEFNNLGLQIELLEHSRDFRANFIDHPQSTKDYDWMTFGLPEGVKILYFWGRGSGYFITYSHQMNDGKKPIEIRTPFPAKEWRVSPHHSQVFLAVWGLVAATLEEFKYI